MRSLLLRPTAPPLLPGIVITVSFIAIETLLVWLLKQVTGEDHIGVVYVLGVFVVSTVWGLGLAATASVASALAFTYIRDWPVEHFSPIGDGVVVTVFLVVTLATNFIASSARARALEADQSRREAGVLAEHHAALRRVATLVASEAAPSQVYSAVADEIIRCLDVDSSGVWRYEPDNAITLVGGSSRAGSQYLAVGERLTIEGDNIGAMVLRSGRAARHSMVENAAGSAVARLREVGIREGVGAPIIVGWRVWGFVVAAWTRSESLPSDSEERIGDFADLVGIALTNATARDELIASRARIVAAADDTRRRLERDLHDGAQQRLVSLRLRLHMVEASVPPEQGHVKKELSGIASGLTGVSSELQEISRGIHPAILSKGGLRPALDTLAQRSTVPVALDLFFDRRLPKPVEVAAYYVVAEGLTNAAKYAQASEVNVCAEIENENLCLVIRDDGKGGADPRKGSGLIGLIDRVEALGGHMHIVSPPGTGTTLFITIPLLEPAPNDHVAPRFHAGRSGTVEQPRSGSSPRDRHRSNHQNR